MSTASIFSVNVAASSLNDTCFNKCHVDSVFLHQDLIAIKCYILIAISSYDLLVNLYFIDFYHNMKPLILNEAA